MLCQNEEKVPLRPLRPLDKEVSAEAAEKGFYQSPSVKRPLKGDTWTGNTEMHESMAAGGLTATPSRDCHALAVHQVWGVEDRFSCEALSFSLVRLF